MPLIRTATSNRFQCYAIQKFLTAITQDIINIDFHLSTVCLYTQIDRIKVSGRLCKNLVIIKDVLTIDLIGLLSTRAADIIINAVFCINFSIFQGICPCERVVVSRKHHINSGLFHCIWNIGRHRCTSSGSVGVIGRLVNR